MSLGYKLEKIFSELPEEIRELLITNKVDLLRKPVDLNSKLGPCIFEFRENIYKKLEKNLSRKSKKYSDSEDLFKKSKDYLAIVLGLDDKLDTNTLGRVKLYELPQELSAYFVKNNLIVREIEKIKVPNIWVEYEKLKEGIREISEKSEDKKLYAKGMKYIDFAFDKIYEESKSKEFAY